MSVCLSSCFDGSCKELRSSLAFRFSIMSLPLHDF
jgi:hypothetical protein